MLKPSESSVQTDSGMAQATTSGSIASIQICPAARTPMKKLDSVRAMENLGLEGDRHAMPDSSRQVLLIEEETLIQHAVPIGAIRENITTRGIALMRLKQGTRLKVGAAEFELTKECAPCAMVDDVRMGLREELQGKRGMLARVIRGGEIRVGDQVQVL